jgi:hypothetical protein
VISGNTTWNNAVAAQQKQPLYVLEIPDVPKYMASFLPSLITSPPAGMLPYLLIPQGAGQSVTETDGHSSISEMSAEAIDYGGELRAMAADPALLGRPALLKLGFPGQAFSDFVTLFYGTLTEVGRSGEGRMTFTVSDAQKALVDTLWLNGGPAAWSPGDPAPAPPKFDNAFADNGQPISDTNPRFLFGNPLDILLVALQNELGLGQNPSLPPPLYDGTQGAGGTDTAIFGPNVSWAKYVPGNDATLINPNSFLDVPGVLALRDSQFLGERMEFTLTRAVTGKSWLDDQILKPLGLFWIAGADGRLRLKSMKQPYTTAPFAVTADHIVGIPEITRLPVINFITVRSQVSNAGRETSARQYNFDQTYVQQTSINRYRQQFTGQIESDGLRSGIGAGARSFLTVNRTFNRHAFGTATYKFTALFRTMVLELGDFILLTYAALADLYTGAMGVSGVLCEVSDRQPDYANGKMTYTVLDTRWFNLPASVYKVPATSVPAWAGASGAQKSAYVFMTSDSGTMSDGVTAGNPIF